jgi:uncharacterized protein YodC (DUF2158 family)
MYAVPKNPFKEGDVVQLKSGGPPMTIQYVPRFTEHSWHYDCQWFSGKKLETGEFPHESLKRVEAE